MLYSIDEEAKNYVKTMEYNEDFPAFCNCSSECLQGIC